MNETCNCFEIESSFCNFGTLKPFIVSPYSTNILNSSCFDMTQLNNSGNEISIQSNSTIQSDGSFDDFIQHVIKLRYYW